jgi:hypothetical protein
VIRSQLFLGKFVRCSDTSVTTKADCVGDMALSQLRLREWVPLEGDKAEAAWGCSDPTVLLQVSTRPLLTRSSSVCAQRGCFDNTSAQRSQGKHCLH